MAGFKWRLFVFSFVSVILFANLYDDPAYACELRSGVFEGLMLAVDVSGNMTGYYREEQGEGVRKTCSFFLFGKATSDDVEITTWSRVTLPGRLKAMKSGVQLILPRGREHSGCALVLLPQIAEGITLDEIMPASWTELRVISAPRALLHPQPSSSAELPDSLKKGDVVGVVRKLSGWLLVEKIDATRGWIQAGETKLIHPP